MRDINRIEPFLEKLAELWKQSPDFRFGQLIYVLADKLDTNDIFFPEEDAWIACFEELIKVKEKEGNGNRGTV